MTPSPAFLQMLEILQTTRGNIRSLGPAGALSNVWEPYTQWLAVVEEAIAAAEDELSALGKETGGRFPKADPIEKDAA